MLQYIKKLFGKKEETPATSINYEDIKPQAVVLTPSTPVSEQASAAVIESIAKPAKKTVAKKPAAKKAPAAKKPRTPKAAK